jgi:uncharacterized protein YecE (DUF72 family)
MPPIFDLYEKFKGKLIDPVVIRLHGGDRENMEERTHNTWYEIADPKDSESLALSRIIQDLTDREHQIFVNVNNHYEGSAPRTIKKIKTLLKSKL